MKVRVVIRGWVELPDDDQDRMAAYGTLDPLACVRIDMENDPAFFFCEILEDAVVG